METLEHIAQMQEHIREQNKVIEDLQGVVGECCRRIVNIELAMQRAEGIVKQNVDDIEEILGNTVLPKNKTRGRVIPLSLVAREIARDNV